MIAIPTSGHRTIPVIMGVGLRVVESVSRPYSPGGGRPLHPPVSSCFGNSFLFPRYEGPGECSKSTTT